MFARTGDTGVGKEDLKLAMRLKRCGEWLIFLDVLKVFLQCGYIISFIILIYYISL